MVSRKVITLWIPLTYIGTVMLLTGLAGKDPVYELLAGGLFLGAFFMATDYVTLRSHGKDALFSESAAVLSRL